MDELNDYDGEYADGRDISLLLEQAYDLLDGFQQWCRKVCKLDERIIAQDCSNVDAFLDYLANYHQKRYSETNEFEVRWFLFSHIVRKSPEDPEAAERVLSSLRRFISYLEDTQGYEVADWFVASLDDTTYYQRRRAQFIGLNSLDERQWQTGFDNWCEELNVDLDARCLLLPETIGGGLFWSKEMGWREATLQVEANRQWQSEREELLADGFGFEQIREHLQISYLEWLDTPQEKLDNQSPFDVIQTEQLEAPEQGEQSSEGTPDSVDDTLWPM